MDIQTDFQNRLFSINEAADHLRVSRSFVYKLIKDKALRPVKLGARTIVRGGELLRFLHAAEETPPETKGKAPGRAL
jgi:excisionase family DNA binding protein